MGLLLSRRFIAPTQIVVFRWPLNYKNFFHKFRKRFGRGRNDWEHWDNFRLWRFLSWLSGFQAGPVCRVVKGRVSFFVGVGGGHGFHIHVAVQDRLGAHGHQGVHFASDVFLAADTDVVVFLQVAEEVEAEVSGWAFDRGVFFVGQEHLKPRSFRHPQSNLAAIEIQHLFYKNRKTKN